MSADQDIQVLSSVKPDRSLLLTAITTDPSCTLFPVDLVPKPPDLKPVSREEILLSNDR